jgi:phosphatidylserine decarboxylase
LRLAAGSPVPGPLAGRRPTSALRTVCFDGKLMTANVWIKRLSERERLNFLLTNRIPRRLLTRFMGWFSRIEHPLVRGPSIALWRLFADDLRLDEAKKDGFASLHDCFTRELKPGARTVDPHPDVCTSPCDGIVGACGAIDGTQLWQVKGFPYSLAELLLDRQRVERHRNGVFVTLRLKSSMYHRFHAPADGRVTGVTHIAGDTWNVNPVALKRIERLYCKNERAVIDFELGGEGGHLTLVPVAAILVAGIRLHWLDDTLGLGYRGPEHIPCDVAFGKGQEMGYFQHGSTIIVFGGPEFRVSGDVVEGRIIRMGQPLLERT